MQRIPERFHRLAEIAFTGLQAIVEDLSQPMPDMVLLAISVVPESVYLAYHGGEVYP